MMKLRIKITKQVLESSKMCPKETTANGLPRYYITENCAIALAIRDIFPKARVYGGAHAVLNYFGNQVGVGHETYLPYEAYLFMIAFDRAFPRERASLPQIEFDIDVPDEVIDKISIDEIRPLLQNHPSLELIESL